MKVVTYQAPDGATINLTAGQVQDLENWGVWPRNRSGEFCQVSHGLHRGAPTYSGQELAVLINYLRGADPAFGRWCEHYGYQPWTAEALADYCRYQEGQALSRSLFAGG